MVKAYTFHKIYPIRLLHYHMQVVKKLQTPKYQTLKYWPGKSIFPVWMKLAKFEIRNLKYHLNPVCQIFKPWCKARHLNFGAPSLF